MASRVLLESTQGCNYEPQGCNYEPVDLILDQKYRVSSPANHIDEQVALGRDLNAFDVSTIPIPLEACKKGLKVSYRDIFVRQQDLSFSVVRVILLNPIVDAEVPPSVPSSS